MTPATGKKWIQIKVRNDGHGPPDDRSTNFVGRVYGLNGKKYPRLSLSVYKYPRFEGDTLEGYGVTASVQKAPGYWWESVPYGVIPSELLDELIELLKLAREKYGEKNLEIEQ